MILGLSTGLLRRVLSYEEIISFFKEIGCDAIELAPEHWSLADESLLKDFKYISAHLQADFKYTDNDTTHRELKLLEKKNLEIGFKCVVIHPTAVSDWNVLKDYKLPWAVENMDIVNTVGITPEEILTFSTEANCDVVLDLNHCFTHDRTMKLADKFYEILGEKIIELHLSGYEDSADGKGRHLPLYLTKQTEILEKIKNIPIILEGSIQTKESVREEFKYLKEMVQKKFDKTAQITK